mmetsp:Transcript_7028/g.14263  ORF Transcript_7028/g.14263 Transcript_7028/m.14263 type:complete len:227 (+) Transcript_7028:2577-3257(+)
MSLFSIFWQLEIERFVKFVQWVARDLTADPERSLQPVKRSSCSCLHPFAIAFIPASPTCLQPYMFKVWSWWQYFPTSRSALSPYSPTFSHSETSRNLRSWQHLATSAMPESVMLGQPVNVKVWRPHIPAAITLRVLSSRLLHFEKSRVCTPVHFIASDLRPMVVTPSHWLRVRCLRDVQCRAIAQRPTSVTLSHLDRLRDVMSGFITHISCTMTLVTSLPVSRECW